MLLVAEGEFEVLLCLPSTPIMLCSAQQLQNGSTWGLVVADSCHYAGHKGYSLNYGYSNQNSVSGLQGIDLNSQAYCKCTRANMQALHACMQQGMTYDHQENSNQLLSCNCCDSSSLAARQGVIPEAWIKDASNYQSLDNGEWIYSQS